MESSINKSIETYVLSNERLEAQGSELYSQSKETQDLVDFLGAVEQPDYAPKLDEISEQVSGIKEVVDSWNKPKLPILKVDVDKTEELEQREARCADLESILEDREARVKSESNKNKVKNVAGKLYFVLGGIAIAGAAVYGEYTGITDFVDYSYLRG